MSAQATGTETLVVPSNGSFSYDHDGLAGLADHAIWPIVVLVLGLVFLIRYFGPLSALIRNVKTAEGFGAKFSAAPQQIATEPPQEAPALAVETHVKPDVAASVDHLSIGASASIAESPEAHEPTHEEDLEMELTIARHSVDAWRRSWQFERIFGAIFGSQVRFLIWLRSPVRSVSKNDVEAWYRENVHPKFFSFEDWIQFLINHELVIVKTPSSGSGLLTLLLPSDYELTKLGAEFVDYIFAQGLVATPRPG